MSNNLSSRQMEGILATIIVQDILLAGYIVQLHDGEEEVAIKKQELATILKAMNGTGQDTLTLWKDGPHQIGWILLIYGNDGWDLIADYSGSPEIETLLARANALADALSEQ